MGSSTIDRVSGNDSAIADNISAIGWGRAMIGVAAVMLMPDSADAQPVSSGQELPPVLVTAPKKQTKKKRAARPTRAQSAPATAAGAQRKDRKSVV